MVLPLMKGPGLELALEDVRTDGAGQDLAQLLERVRTEMSLHVLAYNLKRVLAILGPGPLMTAMRS
jgi:hypothetical protein